LIAWLERVTLIKHFTLEQLAASWLAIAIGDPVDVPAAGAYSKLHYESADSETPKHLAGFSPPQGNPRK
ncbi:MAG: hypothetical protein LC750_16675, partial [Actinobacteria bacterium]|nr:hypothetical protein [Actinomycetota bacterium]